MTHKISHIQSKDLWVLAIADMQTIKLTGDPPELKSALEKINKCESQWTAQRLLPNKRTAYPSLLRTYPLTTERIQ